MTIKCLTRSSNNALHHHVDGGYVHGPHSRLKGNCSGLKGDCSGLKGDCSGIWGYLDHITANMRGSDPDINSYVSEPTAGSNA